MMIMMHSFHFIIATYFKANICKLWVVYTIIDEDEFLLCPCCHRIDGICLVVHDCSTSILVNNVTSRR